MGLAERTGRWARGMAGVIRRRDFSAWLAHTHSLLGSVAFARLARRMASDADGRRVLADRPRVTTGAFDHAWLDALPDATLGKQWYVHLRNNGFIVDIEVPDSPAPESRRTAYAKRRWRETHDFRHALTGLGTSVPDETVLAAFQCAQVVNLFSVLVMILGPIAGAPQQSPLRTWARELPAWRAGRRASDLGGVYWEELLEEPVDALRARFCVPDLSHLSSGGPGAYPPAPERP